MDTASTGKPEEHPAATLKPKTQMGHVTVRMCILPEL